MTAFSTVAAATLLAATATVANAQTQSQVHPTKNVPTPTAFASTAAQDGMTEVAMGGLALRKSHNNRVKQFALGMVTDHAQINEELQIIVKRKGLILPTKLDAKYEAILQRLNEKSGAEFDRAFVETVTSDHAQAMALLESGSRSSDPDVAAFARKTLSTLQEHNQLADRLRLDVEMLSASTR